MDYPRFRSHFWPRTAAGRRFLLAFVALFALAEPPFVFVLANRIEPWILGHPFLYGYLSLVYAALIVMLLLALRRGL
jgi:hypothetical protein